MAAQVVATPKVVTCPEQRRLSDEYLASVREVLRLQNTEMGELARQGTCLAGSMRPLTPLVGRGIKPNNRSSSTSRNTAVNSVHV